MAAPPNRRREVPLWVALGTYLLCWGLGGWLIVVERGEPEPDRFVMILGLGLVLFPILSFDGLGRGLVTAIMRWLDRHGFG